MNLPLLIQRLYGEFTFTGLYSFEFVDRNRNTITEIFLLTPPKSKSVSESTRSTTVPTLGSNYVVDGGNATKSTNLTGKLYFPYIGSPDNPVARDNTGLDNTLNGLEEFFKLQWMLMRYRDYTMTKNGTINIPTTLLSISSEINSLYKKISNKIKKGFGALYDEIRIVFHDYDMDDHYFCRVDNFSSQQSDSEFIAIEYNITLELYEFDTRKSKNDTQVKQSNNEAVDVATKSINRIGFSDSVDTVQDDLGSNTALISAVVSIEDQIDSINTENDEIQAGRSTPLEVLPSASSDLSTSAIFAQNSILNSFLSPTQLEQYEDGDLSLEDVLSPDLLAFFNTLEQVSIQGKSLYGFLKSIPQQDVIRYSENSDDYTLTEEQFDPSGDTTKVESNLNFNYYTVLEGDSSRIIALRELNDAEKFITILRINDITEDDFIDGSIIGQKIKIPAESSAVTRGDNNLVYEADFNDIEKFLYGSDLSGGLTKNLKISPTGDLESTDGIENVYKNIENRISTTKGSLNVFNPDWGTVNIGDGNAPLLVKVDRYLTDVSNQLQADPRVESVQMNLDRLTWENEEISVPSTVFFVGTDETREVTA